MSCISSDESEFSSELYSDESSDECTIENKKLKKTIKEYFNKYLPNTKILNFFEDLFSNYDVSEIDFSFLVDDFEEYLYPSHNMDQDKLLIVKLFLKYMPFRVDYIKTLLTYSKRDFNYIEDYYLNNAILREIFDYYINNIHMISNIDLSSEKINIMEIFLKNKRYDLLLVCLKKFNVITVEIFKEIWYSRPESNEFGNELFDCLKIMFKKYFTVKDKYKLKNFDINLKQI